MPTHYDGEGVAPGPWLGYSWFLQSHGPQFYLRSDNFIIDNAVMIGVTMMVGWD